MVSRQHGWYLSNPTHKNETKQKQKKKHVFPVSAMIAQDAEEWPSLKYEITAFVLSVLHNHRFFYKRRAPAIQAYISGFDLTTPKTLLPLTFLLILQSYHG